jgi:hypothetical protein
MISIGIAVVAAGLHFAGYPGAAFWVIVYAIVNGALATARSVIDPTWYMMKRMEAGLSPDLDLTALIINKGILIATLSAVAWFFGHSAGYF